MVQNPPAGVPRVFPRLCYQDVAAAVDFLSHAFGFREPEGARLLEPDGSIILTEMLFAETRIMLGPPGSHGLESPTKLGGRSQMLLVYVDDVDAHAAHARAAGAELLCDPEDQPWGDRRYEALDPEGHRWYFTQHVRDVPEAEWREDAVE